MIATSRSRQKHTSGPWEVVRESSCFRIVSAVSRWRIAKIAFRKSGSHRGEAARFEPDPDSEADAILIAAAPELADALEALLAGRDGLEVVAFIPIVWVPGEPGSARQEAASTDGAEQARAALRKAGRLP